MSCMFAHERLKAWEASHEMALEVYRASASWPDHERFGLTSRVRRSAISVPLNIVEGAARRGSRQFRQFLNIASGSQAELRYALRLANDLGYLSDARHLTLTEQGEKAGKLVWGLYRKLGAG